MQRRGEIQDVARAEDIRPEVVNVVVAGEVVVARQVNEKLRAAVGLDARKISRKEPLSAMSAIN
ncbi:MAG: hypothetical protein U0641_08115 [Anaerolineae bacterium]